MTVDELKKAVSVMLSEQDNNVKTQAGQTIIDSFTELEANTTKLTTENEQLTERNKQLNEANATMFLRSIGGKTGTEEAEETEETPRERFNRLFDEKYNRKENEK